MKNYESFVNLAKQGDSTACQVLYEDTIDSVHFIISRLVEQAEDAQDLAQDTYLTAFSHLEQLSQPQAFPKWIHNIAANTAKNHLKKHKPVLFSTDEEEERMLNSIPAVGEDFLPEEYASKKELRSCLMEAINALPEKQKTAVYLYYYEDYSVNELSEMLEVRENTVKSRLNAGRDGIRKTLRGMGITSSALVVLALAVRAEAAEYTLPVASRNAIWSGVQQSMAMVGASGSSSGASATKVASSAATKSAGAAAVKAGFLTTVAGKITAAAVAVAVLVGSAIGIGQSNKDKAVESVPSTQEAILSVSPYGIPEELRSIEFLIDQDGEEEFADRLILMRHDFGQLEAVCDFEGIARIEYYPDGYKKLYLERELTQNLPTDDDQTYRLHFIDEDGDFLGEVTYTGSIMSGSFNDTDGYTKIMVNDNGKAIYYLTPNYLRMKEPVRIDIVLEDDPEQKPILTLTREPTGLPITETTEPTEAPLETEAPTEAPTEPAGPALTTKILDLAGCTLQEVSAVLGDYTTSNEFYWFDGGYVGYVYAYGTNRGNNYIQAPLNRLITNCPSSLSVAQLQQFFPGGYTFYDEMDGVNCFAWDYRGCAVVIYEDAGGGYSANSIFYFNCDSLAQQSPQTPQANASVNADLFKILGKTEGQISDILDSESGGYDFQFGCWIFPYRDNYVAVYLDDDGTCIGFWTQLNNALNMSDPVDAAALKQLFGDTYSDPWNGETSYNTMFKGGQLRISQDYGHDLGVFGNQAMVNFRMAGKEIFPPIDGEQHWSNSNSLFYGLMTVYKHTESELVCSFEYSQLTPPNRFAETGKITLTSTDGITYYADSVVDNWESKLTVTVKMLEEAASVTWGVVKYSDYANFAFGDFIAYK